MRRLRHREGITMTMSRTGRAFRHKTRRACAGALVAGLGLAALIAGGPGIAAAATQTPAVASAPSAPPGQPDFGPNVYVFTPSMAQSDIQSTLNSIASQQVPN